MVKVVSSFEGVDQQVRDLLSGNGRVVLGIAGAPGSAKSTLAELVVKIARQQGVEAVQLPMDGFHLADVTLLRQGLAAEKGSPRTFDPYGYISLLGRIREGTEPVYGPSFDRTIEQPIAGAIEVPPGCRLVVTEGNYLLDTEEPWGKIRGLLSVAWFCRLEGNERRRRLIERHIRFGKEPQAAKRWVEEVDDKNAQRVLGSEGRADLVVDVSGWDVRTALTS